MKILGVALAAFLVCTPHILKTDPGSQLDDLGLDTLSFRPQDAKEGVESQREGQPVLLRSSEPNSCNVEMLKSYGFTGNIKPENRTHAFCPKVTRNCCTQEDEKLSISYWKNDISNRMERYYKVYIFSLKYLIGFTQEAFLLARNMEIDDRPHCKLAATEMLSMSLTPDVTRALFKSFVDSARKISDLRKGFYCSLCDADSNAGFKDIYSTNNLGSSDRIYYSRSHCEKLVDHTVQASYNYLNVLKRYLESLTTLMSCKVQSIDKPTFSVDLVTAQQVRNCVFYKHKGFMRFCKDYCESFRPTAVSPLFDGDIVNLQKFVHFVREHRFKAFAYPSNNFLLDGLSFEENYMVEFFPEILRDIVFFRPTQTQSVLLDRFSAEILFVGGIDLWPATEESDYEFTFCGCRRLTLFGLLLVLVLLVIN